MTKVRAGEGTPLFLCHGDFCGWGFYGFRLSEMLEGRGPVYLLHSPLDGAKGIETIEDLASCYLAGVQAAAPDGSAPGRGLLPWRSCRARAGASARGGRTDGREGRPDRRLLAECATAHASDRVHRLLAGTLAAGWAGPQDQAQRHAVGVGACQPSAAARSGDPASGDQDRAQRVDARLGRIVAHDLLPRHVEVPAAAHPAPRSSAFCPRNMSIGRNTRRRPGSIWRRTFRAAVFPANTTPASARMSASSPNG